MPQVKLGSVELFFDEKGTGSPVVFSHGIPTDYKAWKAQVEEVSKSFRAIVYSRRHAYPNKREGDVSDSTINNNSSDLVAFIEELHLSQVNLVGHSFGGYVAAKAAREKPGLFRSLVLVEPAIPSMLVRDEKSFVQKLLFFLTSPSAAMSARKFQTGPLSEAIKAFESKDYTSAARWFYDGIRETPGAFEKATPDVRDMMIDNGLTVGELDNEFPIFVSTDARELKLPTLLVKGENSPKWLREIVDRLSRSLLNCTTVTISKSGHVPHIDNPSEFNSRLNEFLQNSI